MSRYFFHFFEGEQSYPDSEGLLCLSPEEVAERALKGARAILAEDMLCGQLRLDRRIEVTNARGRVVHSLGFEAAFSIAQPAPLQRWDLGGTTPGAHNQEVYCPSSGKPLSADTAAPAI